MGGLRHDPIRSERERDSLNTTDISNKVGRNTKAKYQSGVNRFFKYCEARNIEPIPTEKNLCHFISETSREIKPNSANAYLSAISFHFSESYPEIKRIRMSSKLRDTVKGCQKSFSTLIKQANALSMDDVEKLAQVFNKSFDDLLFNTIVAMGFNGLHRLGELVEPDRIQLRDDRRVIKQWSFEVGKDDSYISYALPYSKTDSAFNGIPVVIPSRPSSLVCPVKTIMRYMEIRDEAFPTNHFLLVQSNGYLPSRGWFMKRLRYVFGNKRSGHSLRAGGATSYAEAGVRTEIIQWLGRWKSDAFETYIHNRPILSMITVRGYEQSLSKGPGTSLNLQATSWVSLIDHCFATTGQSVMLQPA